MSWLYRALIVPWLLAAGHAALAQQALPGTVLAGTPIGTDKPSGPSPTPQDVIQVDHWSHQGHHVLPGTGCCDDGGGTGWAAYGAGGHSSPPFQGSGPARWIVRAEALALDRWGLDEQPIIFRQVDNAELFFMSDFDFELEAGFRGAAQLNLTRRFAVEAVYSAVPAKWSADATVDDNITPGVEPIELRIAGIIVNSPTEPFDVHYENDYHSGEVNAKYYVDYWSIAIFAGARWAQVNERFFAVINGSVDAFTTDTKNELFGGQIGIESQQWLGYGIARLDASLRGGFYYNSASQFTSQSGFADAGASAEDLAWLGESDVALTIPCGRYGSVRGGYRVIHMTGLAVAADQFSVTDLTVPAAGIVNDGDAVYYGWFLGFEAWW